MDERSRKILLKVLLFLNIVFLLFLISGNLAGRTDPSKWWPFSISALLFPILLLIAVATGIFWLFVKPKYALFSLAAILLCIPNLLVSLPANVSSGLEDVKSPAELRVVTWNVNLMNYSSPDDATAIRQNEKIFTTLYELNADVLCLQEFFTAVIPDKTYNFIDSFRTRMGYPYSYFSRDIPKFDKKFYSGTIIFSRYKIIDSSRIAFPPHIMGSIIKAGIVYREDTIDIVSTHLQNINFGRDADKALRDSANPYGRRMSFINRLKYGYADQVNQVKAVQDVMNQSRRPLLFCGDLNDVPTSYTYANIKRDMKDAWMEKGAGLGATFHFILHILRIDYIFFNKYFEAMHTGRIISDASDHYGVVTDLQLNTK